MLTMEEVHQRFAHVRLMFWQYDHYWFTFAGAAPDGHLIFASYGGSPSRIEDFYLNPRVHRVLGAVTGWDGVSISDCGREVYRYVAESGQEVPDVQA